MINSCKEHNILESEAYHNYSVYVHLCEVELLWDVCWGYETNLKTLFCKAKRFEKGPVVVYIPWSNQYPISFSQIDTFQKQFCSDQIILAIRGSDGYLLNYELSRGLLGPEGIANNVRTETKRQPYNKKQLLTQALQLVKEAPKLTE